MNRAFLPINVANVHRYEALLLLPPITLVALAGISIHLYRVIATLATCSVLSAVLEGDSVNLAPKLSTDLEYQLGVK